MIDEAQNIPDIGFKLKLIVDSMPDIKIIITGSSAFDLNQKSNEPLTGRKHEIFIHPISEREFKKFEKPEQGYDQLAHRMVYGNMPELIHLNSLKDKEDYLRELVNSYLFKDILIYEDVKKSSKIINLIRLIAFQAGSEVSLEKLGRELSISKNTVERYLDLLSKVFIIFQLKGFSRNLRKEVTKQFKWFFYDNGIRNAVISNFNNLGLRDDFGKLWKTTL